MAVGRKEVTQNRHEETRFDLRGTFIAVMLLGVFIIVSWFGIYALYLSR